MPEHEPEGRALARAVVAKQAENFPRLDREGKFRRAPAARETIWRVFRDGPRGLIRKEPQLIRNVAVGEEVIHLVIGVPMPAFLVHNDGNLTQVGDDSEKIEVHRGLELEVCRDRCPLLC